LDIPPAVFMMEPAEGGDDGKRSGMERNEVDKMTARTMAWMRKILPVMVTMVLLQGCSTAPDAELVIRGGQLLDMTGEEANLRSIKGLVVRSGKVYQIIADDAIEDLPDAPVVIEAGSDIVMPGLIDAHIHYRPGVAEPALYWGVTTLMDTAPCGAECGDDPNGWIVGHAKQVNSAGDNGPTMYFTGSKLDGPDGFEALEVYRLQSMDEIPVKVEEMAALGASGIKVEQNLPLDYLGKIVEEANKRNLPVVGHTWNAREAIGVGMKFMEHMNPIARATALDAVKAEKENDPAYQMDPEKVPELVELMVSEGVFLNPTILGRYGDMSPRAHEIYDEDLLLLTTSLYGGIAEDKKERYLNGSKPSELSTAERAVQEKAFTNVQQFVKQFSEAGGRALPSTDMGNSRTPGVSLHREMQLFVDAGVTSYKALLGGTRYSAEMMRKTDEIGTLEEGKLADILILGSNPAEDISATRDIRYVIRMGNVVRKP
jgi:imidazolonepropionase-like amidohydrolase